MTRGKIGTGKYSKVIRHIPAVGVKRRFGGKDFYVVGSHTLKRRAKARAKALRRKGYTARVIPTPKTWKHTNWLVYRGRKR